MKVLVYNPLGATKGHSKIYTSLLVNGFLEAGLKCTLLTSGDFDRSLLDESDTRLTIVSVARLRTSIITTGLTSFRKVGYGLFLFYNSLTTFLYTLKHSSPSDLILLSGGDTLFNSLFLIPFGSLRRYFLTIHNCDYDPTLHLNSPIKRLYKAISLKLLQYLLHSHRCELFVHGSYSRGVLVKQIGVDASLIHSYPVPIARQENDYEEYTVPERFVLLFFGVIRYDKGLDILVEALNLLSLPKLTLRIRGSCDQIGSNYVNALLNTISPSIHLDVDLRYFDDDELDSIFKTSTLVILPYRKSFKAQSVVLADSLIRHIPVICTKESENGTIVAKYDCGYTFKAEDISSLCSSIQKAYNAWISGCPIGNKDGFQQFSMDASPISVAKTILEAALND